MLVGAVNLGENPQSRQSDAKIPNRWPPYPQPDSAPGLRDAATGADSCEYKQRTQADIGFRTSVGSYTPSLRL